MFCEGGLRSFCQGRHSTISIGLILLGVVFALTSCETPMVTETDQSAEMKGKSESEPYGYEVNQQLASLRAVTGAYHNFEKAKEAGWSLSLTPCLENPPEGAMGYHYGNSAFIDGTVEVSKPEILVYEPEKNGRLRLVAVEYVIPFSILPSDAEPPTLFGQEFHHNFTYNLWALHAWVWKNNPTGIFATWNPTVSCEHATD